jgi:LacI family transcriptional regulator
MVQPAVHRPTVLAGQSATVLPFCDKRLTTVVVAAQPSFAYVRQILTGIGRFSALQAGWTVSLYPALAHDPQLTRQSLAWRPDGIIACSFSPAISRKIASFGIPLVDMTRGRTPFAWSPLELDEKAVGELALSHLLERGYRQIGMVFGPGHENHVRAEGFRAAARRRGLVCHEIAQDWSQGHLDPLGKVGDLADWLAHAPRPIGLFCYNDDLAQQTATACHRIGAVIPDEVGILGCDDDHMTCFLGAPARSSVIIPHEAMGYRAAQLLAELLAGKALPAREVYAPHEIAVRVSTDRQTLTDTSVGQALAWIATHLNNPISVAEVAAAVGLTRRTLERRTRATLGRTVLQEIHRRRLARAQELLRGKLSIVHIAAAVGFSPTSFHTAFVRHLGVSPGEWRRQISSTWTARSAAPRRRRVQT